MWRNTTGFWRNFFDPQEGFLDENGYLTRTEDNLHIAEDFLEQYYENIMREIR